MTDTAHFRPENAQKIAMKNGGATFYLYNNHKGEPCVQLFIGKSRKPKAFRFRDPVARTDYVSRVIANVQSRKEEADKLRKTRNRPHNLDAGVILYTSWGYDQTNTEFYLVKEAPSKCFVTLQQIAAPLVKGEEGYMSGRRFPDPELLVGEPFRRKVDMSGARASVRIDSVVTAWVWDGKEKSVS